MNGSTLENSIHALREEVSVELADTPDLLLESYRLRYLVYWNFGKAYPLRTYPTSLAIQNCKFVRATSSENNEWHQNPNLSNRFLQRLQRERIEKHSWIMWIRPER